MKTVISVTPFPLMTDDAAKLVCDARMLPACPVLVHIDATLTSWQHVLLCYSHDVTR